MLSASSTARTHEARKHCPLPASSSQVARFLVNLGGLRPSHRVGTIGRAIEFSARDPRMHDPRILSRREARLSPKTAREQISPVPCVDVGEPVPDRCSGRFGDFEPDRSTGLPLDHSGTVSHLATDANVVDLQPYKVAAPQLAVDGEIEQGEVALTVLQLKPKSGAYGSCSPGATMRQGWP